MEDLKLNLSGTDNFFVQEAYRFLRTNIQFCGNDVKTIAITSCNENEGKTTVSLNIAKVFAELGKKVLLVDADMRKSVLAGRNFNARNFTGLSEILTGQEQDVPKCLHRTDIPNMFVLLAGVYPPNPSELLSNKYFASLIRALRDTFDYVIVDTPPLGAVTDAAIIAPQCDGTILVVGNSHLNRTQAQNVIAQLQSSGTKILGAIRNNVDKSASSKHNYYSKYGYYKKKSSKE